MKFAPFVALASGVVASTTIDVLDRRATSGSYVNTLSKNQRELFLWGMDALDNLYADPLIVRHAFLFARGAHTRSVS